MRFEKQRSDLPKIRNAGQICQTCGTPVEKKEHRFGERVKLAKQGCYYAWWLVCPKCSTVYLDDRAMRKYDKLAETKAIPGRLSGSEACNDRSRSKMGRLRSKDERRNAGDYCEQK